MDANSGNSSENLVQYEDLGLKVKSELLSNRNNEELQKVVNRLQMLEEHLRHLYDSMVEFLHVKAMLRDSGDRVAKALNLVGQLDQLPVPTSSNYTMILLGDAVLNIGDKVDSEISQFEAKIFPIFSSFGSAFKSLRSQLHLSHQTEDQHEAKRNDYVRFIERQRNIDEEKFAEREEHLRQKLVHCMSQSSACRRKCIKKLAKLEMKKCEDLKKIMSNWFQGQASTAAKTLEVSTEACQTANSIDTSGDVQKLFKHLNLLDSIELAPTEAEADEVNQNDANADADPSNESYHNDSSVLLSFPVEKKDNFACGDSIPKRFESQHQDDQHERRTHKSKKSKNTYHKLQKPNTKVQ